MNRTPLLTPEDERALIDRWRAGDRTAGDALCRAVLHLLWRFARAIGRRNGVRDYDELFGSGLAALPYVLAAFDPSVARWGTYAGTAAARAMRRAARAIIERAPDPSAEPVCVEDLPAPEPEPSCAAELGPLLARLDVLSRRALDLHYGLTAEPLSVPRVAQRLGLSLVRTRAVLDSAIERLGRVAPERA